WECWKRAGGLNVGTPRIRHFDETRFDFRVIDFIEFDVLGNPPISRTERSRPTIEANHVNSGVYARSCSIAALDDCGVGKEILVCARFHPSLTKVRLKEQASQDTRVRDACDRPTAGTSRVTRQSWVHGAENAVLPYPSATWETVADAVPV